MPDETTSATGAQAAPESPPLPTGSDTAGASSPSDLGSGGPKDRLADEEWNRPRRIATIVAFALGAALYFGTAAALFRIPNALPVSPLLALLGGIAALPPLFFFVAGLERPCIRFSPLLMFSAGCGLESYFVGGTIGIASPTTLGAAAITIVLYLMVGHRAKESHRRRVKRVRRWGRNAAVLGIVLVVVAVGCYASYISTPPLPTLAANTLDESTFLAPGQHVYSNTSLTGSPGDVLFVLLAVSNTSAPVVGTVLNPQGIAMANITAGNVSSPSSVFLDLRVNPGSYGLLLTYPSGEGGPASVDVRWTEGNIPAGVQAETGVTLSSGWVGFALFILGFTLWIVARPPAGPAPVSTEGPAPPEGASPSRESGSETSTRTEGVEAKMSDTGTTEENPGTPKEMSK